MKKKPMISLTRCLQNAISLYNVKLNEEQGGFILKEAGKENYEFVPIKNQLSGTARAVGLYVADIQEFNNKVALRTLDDKWSIYASYHTHPNGMRAMPSIIDLTMLFTSFPTNFIYAHGIELNRFDFDTEFSEYSRMMTSPQNKWRLTPITKF